MVIIAYSLMYILVFSFRQILVVHTNISFCERSKFNPFTRTFVYFTIAIFTWHDFMTYSIVLTMSISARGLMI